jgi:peptide-methionine (R)-S-oxide reductase
VKGLPSGTREEEAWTVRLSSFLPAFLFPSATGNKGRGFHLTLGQPISIFMRIMSEPMKFTRRHALKTALLVAAGAAIGVRAHSESQQPDSPEAVKLRAKLKGIPMDQKVNLTNDEWRKILTPEQYSVMREAGTEAAFCNAYWNNHGKGKYRCAACDNLIFDAATKFDSGTGWPSFYQPVKGSVTTVEDSSFGMVRTEVRCARCDSHLGHVFDDGPPPTGMRYCMNSVSLNFVPEK